MKEKIQHLLKTVKARIPTGAVRWGKLLLTAWFVGGVGESLVENSRWVGVIDQPDMPKESLVYRFFVRQPGRWLGEALARLSFDLPQMSRNVRPTPEICVVYLDEQSSKELGQSSTWDRAIHGKLLRKLKEDGAKAVFFDIVFASSEKDPVTQKDIDTPSDLELASAVKDFGNTFIGASIDLSFRDKRSDNVKINPPKSVFRKAGATWGLLAFRPIDSDFGIRSIFTGTEQVPSLSWKIATKLGAPLSQDPADRAQLRWLNYYGAAGTFVNCSYFEALGQNTLPPGFFKDRIVFVGGRDSLAVLDSSKDTFFSPYTRLPNGQFMPGVEIHATAALNLLRHEWLTRLPIESERRFAFWFGFFLVLLLVLRGPWVAWGGAALAMMLITLLAIYGVQSRFVWGNWMVLAFIQPAMVAVANYFFEGRRRSALKKAFGLYLSPEMANQISSSDMDLKPGGKVVDGTIMFTDLEGFTSLSEELDDPERLSRVLSGYFTQCTGHVLELNGTIAKFIGDAVLAVWGAPLPNPNHVRDAVLSAWRLHKDSEILIDGVPLIVRGKKVRTRIGVHTGLVLAGNLGSEQRFDWTVIGDPVNLAARLESLNKHLGTSVLISHDAFLKMGPGFTTRRLGAYIMKGKAAALVIHELLGEEGTDAVPEWLPDFLAAVAAFEKGDTAAATELFQKVIATRGGTDGPSTFLLEEMERRAADPATPWDPEIELHEK